jgi:hypothetical protein
MIDQGFGCPYSGECASASTNATSTTNFRASESLPEAGDPAEGTVFCQVFFKEFASCDQVLA